MVEGTWSCLLETTRFISQDSAQLDCLVQVAYQANWVYFFLVAMMLLSAVGLPLPEELTLITVGFLAHIATHPHLYPIDATNLNPVDPKTTAIVAFFAVFLSDLLIFTIGRKAGPKVFAWGPVARVVNPKRREQIARWTQKYGALAVGLFRFTPGIRFPGHLACGMVGIPVWKFITIDAIAVLISVPTQIFIFAKYGREILSTFQNYKFIVLGCLIVAGLVYFYKKFKQDEKSQAA